MAVEVFGNLPATTVTSGGTDAPAAGTQETWTVGSSSSFPAVSSTGTPPTQCHVADIADNSEMIAVTNISGTTWTVTRGAEGSTPVAHTAGFTVYQVTSAGAFTQLRAVDWLNVVTMFGADPTGTGDSSAALLAAISAAGVPAAAPAPPGNGTVYVPGPGTYIVSEEIAWTCSFVMDPGAVIKAASGYTGVLCSTPKGTRVNGLTFTGGTFDGNQNAQNCFWGHQMTGCTWYGGRFQNAVQDDVVIGDPSDTGFSYGNVLIDFHFYRTTSPVGSGYSNLWLTSYGTDTLVYAPQGGSREIGIRVDGGDNKFITPHWANGFICAFEDNAGSNNVWVAPIPDSPGMVSHTSASAASGVSAIDDPSITAAHQGLPVAGSITTVAAGSNGGEISAIASWSSPSAGVLDVAGVTGFTASGSITVVTSTTVATVTYTGTSGNSFTGCAYVSGSATGTVATGGTVTQVGIPVGNAFVGAVTPGTSFTLVDALGVATDTTETVAGITLVGVGFNLQGASAKQIVAPTFINGSSGLNGICYAVCTGETVPRVTISGGISVIATSISNRWLETFIGYVVNLSYMGLYEDNIAVANSVVNSIAGAMAIEKGTLNPFVDTQSITSGTAFTPPSGGRDVSLVLPVATSSSGTLTLTMGPSTGTENTILSANPVAAGQVITVHVPSAWKVVVTLSGCTLGTATITAL